MHEVSLSNRLLQLSYVRTIVPEYSGVSYISGTVAGALSEQLRLTEEGRVWDPLIVDALEPILLGKA